MNNFCGECDSDVVGCKFCKNCGKKLTPVANTVDHKNIDWPQPGYKCPYTGRMWPSYEAYKGYHDR